MERAAFAGSYADLKFIRTRKVAQVVVEIPIEDASRFIEAFGAPNPASEVPVAIARLNHAVEGAEKPKRSWSDLPPSQQAAMRCEQAEFQLFMAQRFAKAWNAASGAYDARAKSVMCGLFGIASRSQLDSDEKAAGRWLALDDEFTRWKLGATR